MSQSLQNKIALITGASSGIGSACAQQFAAKGARVILTARRIERIESLAKDIKEKYQVDALPIQLDVQDQAAVNNAINSLPESWQQIDILLNNAGLALASDPIQNCDPKNWETMIDTNIKGLLYVTKAILPGMINRNRGHIVNIGSVAGHQCYPGGNVYCATKHAVKAISRSMRIDLSGYAIRVTEIDPAAVNTEFSAVRWQDAKKADKFYDDFTPLVAADVADTIMFCVTRPAHVNISELVVYPTDQASAQLIHHSKKSSDKK